MISLAVVSAFLTLALQLSDFTGGEDGLNFKVPVALQPATVYLDVPWLGATIDGRFATHCLLFGVALLAGDAAAAQDGQMGAASNSRG